MLIIFKLCLKAKLETCRINHNHQFKKNHVNMKIKVHINALIKGSRKLKTKNFNPHQSCLALNELKDKLQKSLKILPKYKISFLPKYLKLRKLRKTK